MNRFGGNWTKTKIEMLVEYAHAYLTIMNKYPHFRLLYFDGFAGTGFIEHGKKPRIDMTIGAARRIVELDQPKSFDGYYFVEKNHKKAQELRANLNQAAPQKKEVIYIVEEDCNLKIKDLADYMNRTKSERKYDKLLAYIDPAGMQLDWNALESLKGIGADVWILVPTGLGVNRLLDNKGNLKQELLNKLTDFLGMPETDIRDFFYEQKTELTLFGEETRISKEESTIQKAAELYRERLRSIFKFVSEPFELCNSRNSVMYHLLFMSNNEAGLNVANDIIKKYQN